MPGLRDMTLVRQWHFAARVAHKVHIKSAARAESMNTPLGVPAWILSAIVGTAIFASLSQTNPEGWQKIIFGLLSMLATVLTALQTHLGFSQLAELHRKSAGRYGTVRRQLEELLGSYSDAHPCDDSQIDPIGKAWSDIEAAAPSLSQRLYAKLEREIREDEQRDEGKKREQMAREENERPVRGEERLEGSRRNTVDD